MSPVIIVGRRVNLLAKKEYLLFGYLEWRYRKKYPNLLFKKSQIFIAKYTEILISAKQSIVEAFFHKF